jgi:predicted ATPase
MNYWLVRAKWGMESKKAEFINKGYWINGYDDKYLDVVKRVEIEDILLLAEDSTITHYGKCIDNPKDGKHLTVDKWEILCTSMGYAPPGTYVEAISIINDSIFEDYNILGAIRNKIEVTKTIKDTKINSIEIENFTVFKKHHILDFSDNLNIVIGENGLGKTQLLKLLGVLITSNNLYLSTLSINKSINADIEQAISQSLNAIFKADSLFNLISWTENKSHIVFNLNRCHLDFSINSNSEIIKESDYVSTFKKEFVFIPAKEILSFYEGFISLYENRETSFDEIYYNLAKSLGLSNLKNIESYPVEYKLICKLEEILEGKILLERGRFYLVSHKDNRKTEIALIAEGLRKIGMIAQLLANGSLTKNSILFWDEPETNLNPRLIRKMAEVLMELSRAGMQIFIATHSLFLVKEIEILRNKQDKVKYFGLGFDENKEIRVSQSEDFGNLKDTVILDEELDQADRFQFNYHQPQ